MAAFPPDLSAILTRIEKCPYAKSVLGMDWVIGMGLDFPEDTRR
jgi:hypothetical protein